jgi:hypothetical protein
MKRKGIFYTWLVPILWIMMALLSYLFPGGENITLGFGLFPGVVWLGNGGSSALLLCVGALSMVCLGAIADWRCVRRASWFRCLAFFACLVLGMLMLSFFGEALRTSLARASNKFDLARPDRVTSFVLLCLEGGLYIGTAFGIILTFKTDERRAA